MVVCKYLWSLFPAKTLGEVSRLVCVATNQADTITLGGDRVCFPATHWSCLAQKPDSPSMALWKVWEEENESLTVIHTAFSTFNKSGEQEGIPGIPNKPTIFLWGTPRQGERQYR